VVSTLESGTFQHYRREVARPWELVVKVLVVGVGVAPSLRAGRLDGALPLVR
jgi:hypothetical protein